MENQNKLFLNLWNNFILEAVLFSLTLLLGIISAFRINKILEAEKISEKPLSLFWFLFYFLLATLIILFVSRFKKFQAARVIFFKAIFILATFWGSLIILSSWLPDFLTLIIAAILIFWWLKSTSILIHNLLVILGIGGLGSVLGLRFSPEIIILLFIIFSVYDVIAVYKTKHMVEMAKEMLKTGAILGLIAPQKISDFTAHIKEVMPGGRFLILGGGDVAFPLLLAVSLVPTGLVAPLIIALFSLFGLFLNFYILINQKVRQPLPALPAIALFSIMGFLIIKLF